MQKNSFGKLLLRSAVPVIILAFAFFTANLIIKSKPEVKRKKPPKQVLTVEVMDLEKSNFQVWLKSYGTIRPRTQSTLIPEVSGRIIKVSEKFRSGAFFEKGDLLLEIDPRNYKSTVIFAHAEWLKAQRDLEMEKSRINNYETSFFLAASEQARAELNLKEEEAKSKLAIKNWQKLGKKGEPGVLVLRKPQLTLAQSQLRAAEAKVEQSRQDLQLTGAQLRAAEALVVSARAQLKQKEVELERTKIMSPYAGLIKKQLVDIGQYVSQGTILAEIFAVDYSEISLPLTDHQVNFIDLPELYRGGHDIDTSPLVKLIISQGNKKHTFDAHIIRTEGMIDSQTQQIFVIAQINNPYARKKQNIPPLKMGQFVEAEIKGVLLEDVFVVPRSALREGHKVLIVNESDELSERKVNVVWVDNEQAVIKSGINRGERLSLTPVQFLVKNKSMKVQIKAKVQP